GLQNFTRPRRPQSRQYLRNLQRADGDLAGAAIAFLFETDVLPFGETANASALQSRRMDEYVVAAVVRCDEAEAFLAIVEFNGTASHGDAFSQWMHTGFGSAHAAEYPLDRVWREFERAPSSAQVKRPNRLANV